MRGILLKGAFAAGVLLANAALADPVGPDQAAAMLFEPTGMVFYPVDPKGLDAEATAKVVALQEGMGAQMGAFELGGFGYYGALAVPKGQALKPESLTMSQGLHSPTAAQVAVLEQCKEAHKAECTVIGLTLPAGYNEQPLSLSANATKAFSENAGDGPVVVAYSASTAGSALAKGAGEAVSEAALAACNNASDGADDCVIGIAQE